MSSQDPARALTRRGILAAGGAVLIGAAGALAPGSAALAAAEPGRRKPPGTIPFHGRHQAGIDTPAALMQTFVGLNLSNPSRANARAVLELVTDTARRLTQGRPALGDMEPELAVNAARHTVTVGVGAGFLAAAGAAPPVNLRTIPEFSTDRLKTKWSQTDFMLQIAADDPLTLAHTTRVLFKDLSTLATVAWTQDGFISPAPANPGSLAGRNLMGQVDGTVNPRPGTAEFDETVWIDAGPAWAIDGTILVLRRIVMDMDEWDKVDPADQERTIGRRRASGAPLTGGRETDPLDLDARDQDGDLVIPADAHARLAHTASPREAILRRGYNYDTGVINGRHEQGLLFAAYMRDPATSFIPMQERLSAHDALNKWTTAIGSATYLILPGTTPDSYLGKDLLS